MLTQWFNQRRYRQYCQALQSSPLVNLYTPPVLDNEQRFIDTDFFWR